MKRITCTLAALAMVMWTYIPAQAECLGTLLRSSPSPATATVNNDSIFGITAVTVYYLDDRELDVVVIESVPAGQAANISLPRLGRATNRVIIEVDPPPSGVARVSVNGGSFICFGNCGSDRPVTTGRLVYNVE